MVAGFSAGMERSRDGGGRLQGLRAQRPSPVCDMFSFGNVDISDVDFNDAWQDGHFPDRGAEFPGEAGERVEGGVAGVVT